GSASSYSVRDLWAHTTSTSSGTVSATVAGHSAVMYLVSGGAVATSAPATTRAPTSAAPTTGRPPTSAVPTTSRPATSAVPTTRPPVTSAAPPGRACTATYKIVGSWPGGF